MKTPKIDTDIRHIFRLEQIDNCLRIFYKDGSKQDLEIKVF